MTTHRGNFAFRPLPEIQSGDVFEDCNLSRSVPHTMVGDGCTGLVVRGMCNLTNCDFPPDTVFEKEYVRRQISWCRHVLEAALVDGETDHRLAMMPQEPDNCQHVDTVYEIQTDSRTVYEYDRSHKEVA